MSFYENMSRIRVEEALKEGVESQRAFRARASRPSRIKDFLKSVSLFVKRRFFVRSSSDTAKLSRPGERIQT